MHAVLTILALWLVLLTTNAVFCVSTAIIARALGARVREVALFVGPAALRFTIASFPIALRILPVPMSYVAFEPSADSKDEARTHFHELSRARRVAIVVLPWVIIALVCVALLGPEVALGSIARGFVQIVHGALSPTHTGSALVQRLIELAASEPWHRFGALVATKHVVTNFLPLPGVAGFTLLAELLQKRPGSPVPSWVTAAGLIVMLALGVGWAWAIVAAVSS